MKIKWRKTHGGIFGYDANDQEEKNTTNRRNGYGRKTLKSSAGTIPVRVPRDRDATFEPKLVEKRQSNIAEIEDKILGMYARGMSQRDIFISMDGVSGLEQGAKAIFGQQVVVQRCIVHLIRNSLKYIPSKEYKHVTQDFKKLYAAPSIEAYKSNYEVFEEKWSKYPGAVKVWINNREHVERLYDYGHSVRKLMYTTNAIESINSSFRKVTKKGAFLYHRLSFH